MTRKGMVYKLADINSLDKNDLFPYELLMDRTKNDLILVNEDKSTFSFKDYITSIASDYLKKDHIKLTNQHPLASYSNSGFMSVDDKKDLDNAIKSINILMEYMSTSLKTGSFTVDDSFTYKITDNGIILSGIIHNNNISIVLDELKTIDIGDRPDKDFVNANNKIGYRDDFIYCDLDDDYEVKIVKDVIFVDNELVIRGTICEYNEERHVYKYGDSEIVPLLRIRRRNSSLISSSNVLGKLNDIEIVSKKEIIDITRRKIGTYSLDHLLSESINEIDANSGTRIHSKIFKTNIKHQIDPFAISYIEFNNNDSCQITNQSLGKKIMYKKSPFGLMMRKSRNIGNFISFNKINTFTLEFLLDTSCFDQTSVASNEIIILKNSTLDNTLVVSGDINNKLINISCSKDGIFQSEVLSAKIDTSIKYQFIKIVLETNNIKLYVNEKLLCSSKADNLDTQFLQICSLDFSIGNVLLTPNIEYKNELINDNTYLIDNITVSKNNYVLIDHDEKFTNELNTSDNFNFELSLIDSGKISENDALYIYFNNEIIDVPICEECKVTMASGNKITISKGIENIKVGDLVRISKGIDNINNRYKVIDIQGSVILLDKIIKSKYIGYTFSKFELTIPAKIYVNGEELRHVIREDYYIKILFDKEYPIDSEFEVKYIEKISEDNTLNKISDLDSALFGDKFSINNNNVLKNIDKTSMNIYYNNSAISYTNKTKSMVIINDKINLKINFNIKDFINIYEDKNTILNSLKLLFKISLSGGSNDILINGKKINTNGYLIPYQLTEKDLIIDDKFNVTVNISTSKGIKNGKLIISDCNCLCYLDNSNTFNIENAEGKVTDFAIISNKELFINSNSEIEIYAEEVEDNYLVLPNNIKENQLTDINDEGYSLININNIIRLFHNEDRKYYYLNHFYIVE